MTLGHSETIQRYHKYLSWVLATLILVTEAETWKEPIWFRLCLAYIFLLHAHFLLTVTEIQRPKAAPSIFEQL